MVSQEYRESIVEVLEILKYSDNEMIEKIPQTLLAFWERNQSTTYKPNIDHHKKIQEMELRPKTRAILTMLYINYLCDEKEKKEMIFILKKNEQIYQNDLKERYNVEQLFKKEKQKKQEQIKNEVTMIPYKPSWLEKIRNHIKAMFK